MERFFNEQIHLSVTDTSLPWMRIPWRGPAEFALVQILSICLDWQAVPSRPPAFKPYASHRLRLFWLDILGDPEIHGLDRRKNKFPAGGVMVMEFVPLAVLMLSPLVVQFAGAGRFALCCNV